MKVLDLRCADGHSFEGWFGSEADFLLQDERQMIECPLCASRSVTRLPSAPRLNLSGASEPAAPPVSATDKPPAGPGAPVPGSAMQVSAPSSAPVSLPPPELQALWMQTVREVMKRTEDVGDRFPDEARRMHYGEIESRGIRGQATPEERAELAEEGIEVMALPVPRALKGPLQ